MLYKIKNRTRSLYLQVERVDRCIHNSSKSKISLFFLILLLFGVGVFIMNLLTPILWDDSNYSFIWGQGKLRVETLSDIFTSQYAHYFTWGGRTVVHSIAQFLLLVNPLVADILNTGVYLMYASLIYLHIVGRGKHDLLLFSGVNFLIWFLQPVFGETILWLTGSANYLWGTSIILLFLLPFRLFDGKDNSKNVFLKSIGMFLLGVLAGWTNENTATGGIFIAVSYIIYFHRRKQRVPHWAIVGCVGALIGYVFMITAPGNFVRAELRTEGIPLDFFHLSYRFLTSTQLLFQYLGVLNLIGFILILLYKSNPKDKEDFSSNGFLIFTYFVAALISLYIMLFSPFFPPRAWFGVVTFNIISFGLIVYNLNYSLSVFRELRLGIFFFGIALFAFTYYDAIRDVIRIDNEWDNRKKLISKQVETGEVAVLHWTYSRTKFALSDPPFLAGSIALYYNVEVEVK